LESEVRASVPEDVPELAGVISPEAANFLRVGWDVEPEAGIASAFKLSGALCWTARVDGEMAAMFGCAPGGLWGTGCPWLVTAPALERAKIRFIRQSRPYIALMLDTYPLLRAYVYRGNRPLIAWMKWAGFVFADVSDMFCRGELSALYCDWYDGDAWAGRALTGE